MFELALGGVAGEICGAENLLEMVRLALIDDVKRQVRAELGLALDDGGEVGGAVHRRAFRRYDEQRRHVLLVGLACHADDLRALVGFEQALGLQVGDHRFDERIGVGFALPPIESNVERTIVADQGFAADGDEVRPQSAIAAAALLQLARRLLGAVAEGFVGLALVRRHRIETLEIFQRDGCCRWIGAGEGFIEIRQAGLFIADGNDQKAHLIAPVAEVRVTDDLVTQEAQDALQAFTDHRGAQMADVHRLGDVGPAEIDDDLAFGGNERGAQAWVGGDRIGARAERRIGQDEVEETRTGDIDRFQPRVTAQMAGDTGGDITRIGLGLFGDGKRAIALKISQVGTVGRIDAAGGGLKAFADKGLTGGRGQVATEIVCGDKVFGHDARKYASRPGLTRSLLLRRGSRVRLLFCGGNVAEVLALAIEVGHLRRDVKADQDLEIRARDGDVAARDLDIGDLGIDVDRVLARRKRHRQVEFLLGQNRLVAFGYRHPVVINLGLAGGLRATAQREADVHADVDRFHALIGAVRRDAVDFARPRGRGRRFLVVLEFVIARGVVQHLDIGARAFGVHRLQVQILVAPFGVLLAAVLRLVVVGLLIAAVPLRVLLPATHLGVSDRRGNQTQREQKSEGRQETTHENRHGM